MHDGQGAVPAALCAPIARLLMDQFRYEIRLLVRYPRAIAAGALIPIVMLTLHDDARDAQTTVAGMTVLALTITSYTTHAIGLVTARETGVLKRWRGGPLPAWCYFGGRIGATIVLAVEGAAATVIAGRLLLGTHLDVAMFVEILAVAVAGSLTWAAIGTAVTAVIPSVESAWPILALTYFPLMFASDTFGASHEPEWVGTVSHFLPAQPVLDAASIALHAGGAMPARDVVVLAAWTVASLSLSAATFRWQPRSPHPARP